MWCFRARDLSPDDIHRDTAQHKAVQGSTRSLPTALADSAHTAPPPHASRQHSSHCTGGSTAAAGRSSTVSPQLPGARGACPCSSTVSLPFSCLDSAAANQLNRALLMVHVMVQRFAELRQEKASLRSLHQALNMIAAEWPGAMASIHVASQHSALLLARECRSIPRNSGGRFRRLLASSSPLSPQVPRQAVTASRAESQPPPVQQGGSGDPVVPLKQQASAVSLSEPQVSTGGGDRSPHARSSNGWDSNGSSNQSQNRPAAAPAADAAPQLLLRGSVHAPTNARARPTHDADVGGAHRLISEASPLPAAPPVSILGKSPSQRQLSTRLGAPPLPPPAVAAQAARAAQFAGGAGGGLRADERGRCMGAALEGPLVICLDRAGLALSAALQSPSGCFSWVRQDGSDAVPAPADYDEYVQGGAQAIFSVATKLPEVGAGQGAPSAAVVLTLAFQDSGAESKTSHHALWIMYVRLLACGLSTLTVGSLATRYLAVAQDLHDAASLEGALAAVLRRLRELSGKPCGSTQQLWFRVALVPPQGSAAHAVLFDLPSEVPLALSSRRSSTAHDSSNSTTQGRYDNHLNSSASGSGVDSIGLGRMSSVPNTATSAGLPPTLSSSSSGVLWTVVTVPQTLLKHMVDKCQQIVVPDVQKLLNQGGLVAADIVSVQEVRPPASVLLLPLVRNTRRDGQPDACYGGVYCMSSVLTDFSDVKQQLCEAIVEVLSVHLFAALGREPLAKQYQNCMQAHMYSSTSTKERAASPDISADQRLSLQPSSHRQAASPPPPPDAVIAISTSGATSPTDVAQKTLRFLSHHKSTAGGDTHHDVLPADVNSGGGDVVSPTMMLSRLRSTRTPCVSPFAAYAGGTALPTAVDTLGDAGFKRNDGGDITSGRRFAAADVGSMSSCSVASATVAAEHYAASSPTVEAPPLTAAAAGGGGGGGGENRRDTQNAASNAKGQGGSLAPRNGGHLEHRTDGTAAGVISHPAGLSRVASVGSRAGGAVAAAEVASIGRRSSCRAAMGGFQGGDFSGVGGSGRASFTTALATGLTDKISMHRTTSTMDPANASDLANLEFLGLLGRGGYGFVFQGKWRGMMVAIKLVQYPKPEAGGHHRADLKHAHEVAILSSVSHPNIIQAYAFLSDVPLVDLVTVGLRTASREVFDHKAFRELLEMDALCCQIEVLELCDKGTIIDALRHGWFMDLPKSRPAGSMTLGLTSAAAADSRPSVRSPASSSAANAAARPNMQSLLLSLVELASALAHLHSLGIVHCDIKPDNVLLKSSTSDARGFTLKLADFGLSRVQDHQCPTFPCNSCGTLAYVAPEALSMKKVDHFIDVYSFGILMYELYANRRPYAVTRPEELLHAVVMLGMRPVFKQGAHADYVNLARACWDTIPANRPNFSDIIAELHRMLNTVVGSAERPVAMPKRS